MARALWRCFGVQFMAAGVLKLCHDSLQFMSPLLLRKIVQYLQDPAAPFHHGLGLALLLLGCNVLQSLCIHNYFHMVYRVAVHVSTAGLQS